MKVRELKKILSEHNQEAIIILNDSPNIRVCYGTVEACEKLNCDTVFIYTPPKSTEEQQ